jgi:hypothetical protein
LNWQDRSANESSFKIERAFNGVNFAPRTTVAANVTSFTDSGLVNWQA